MTDRERLVAEVVKMEQEYLDARCIYLRVTAQYEAAALALAALDAAHKEEKP